MRKRILSLCLLAALSSFSRAQDAPDGSGVVQFPNLGEVVVRPIEQAGQVPKIRFTLKSSGQLLLNVAPVDGALYRIDREQAGFPSQPISRFRVFEKVGLPKPIVIAAAMFPGGSDCSYRVALAGEFGGRLLRLTAVLPNLNTEGGFALLDSTDELGAGLVLWNMVWRDGESHPEPHDHWFRFYKFDPATGGFIFAKSWTANKKQQKFRFQNLLFSFPDFGC